MTKTIIVPRRDVKVLVSGDDPPDVDSDSDGADGGGDATDEKLHNIDEGSDSAAPKMAPGSEPEEETELDTDEVVVFDDEMLDEYVPDPDLAKGLSDEIARLSLFRTEKDVFSLQQYIPHPSAVERDRVYTYDNHHPGASVALAGWRAQVAGATRAVTLQMRRMLSAQSQSRNTRDQDHGRLDRSRLHALNTPGRLPNKSIFMKHTPGKTLKTSVYLFVDQSGSMSGAKIETARLVALVFGDALASCANMGVRFGVGGFDAGGQMAPVRVPNPPGVKFDRVDPLRMHVYKTFDEPWRVVEPRLVHMMARLNNVDGESIRWAGQNLLAEKTTRRILIVFSDGMPAGSTEHNDPLRMRHDLKNAVAELTRSGVEVWAVGIMHKGVEEFYPNRIVINSISELESKVVDLLKTSMLGE